MNDFAGLYEIRDATPEDHNFVLATFLRGLYYGDSWYSKIEKHSFMTNYQKVVAGLIARDLVKVACLPDDKNVILGYSILSRDFSTVHWVYVKSVWRKKGIARALCPKHPQAVTHLTDLGESLLKKIGGPIFDPFKL